MAKLDRFWTRFLAPPVGIDTLNDIIRFTECNLLLVFYIDRIACTVSEIITATEEHNYIFPQFIHLPLYNSGTWYYNPGKLRQYACMHVAKTQTYPVMSPFLLFITLCDHNPPTLQTDRWISCLQHALNMLKWLKCCSYSSVEQGLTSHQTHYRSYRGQVLWVKRPNQQCQSTERREVIRTQASIPLGQPHCADNNTTYMQ